jgi:succinoglycan biosynthesis transport protein ExoP
MPKASAAPEAVELRSEALRERDPLPLLKGLDIARRHSSTIGLAGAVGLGLGLLYLLMATSQYTAVALLVTDTRRTHAVPAVPEVTVDPAVIESQIEMIRSEKISRAVIRRLNLENDPEFVGTGGLLSSLVESIGLGEHHQEISPAIRQRRALDRFDRSLRVSQIGRSYVADIRFTSSDPAKAARIANAIAESYIDDQLEAFTTGATRAGSWIKQRLDALRRLAKDAAAALEAFKSENGIAGANQGTLDGDVQARFQTLEATAASFRRSYETFQNLDRYSETIQEQSLPVTEARVLSEALPPVTRSAPKTGVTLLLSLLLGCGLGVTLAFAREHLDRTVRTRKQLEAELGIKSLGCLPLLSSRKMMTNWRRRILKSRARFLRLPGPPADRVAALFKQDRTFPQAREALINIRVAIDARNYVSGCRVIGITSARDHEGKTTVALNLADSIAGSGKRVLLVDGDLRARSLTTLLASDCVRGLPEALAGSLALNDLLPCPNFSFHLLPQPPGQDDKCPPEVLSSKDMRALLAQARRKYDYVIIDLPAALDHVDAVTMAGLIDAFVLVAEWQRTRIDELEQVLLASGVFSERLVGAVINKVDGNGMRDRRTA